MGVAVTMWPLCRAILGAKTLSKNGQDFGAKKSPLLATGPVTELLTAPRHRLPFTPTGTQTFEQAGPLTLRGRRAGEDKHSPRPRRAAGFCGPAALPVSV